MPIALASEARPWEGAGWRAVEAQHKSATLGLVHGNLAEQDLLEVILVKPNRACQRTQKDFIFYSVRRFDICRRSRVRAFVRHWSPAFSMERRR